MKYGTESPHFRIRRPQALGLLQPAAAFPKPARWRPNAAKPPLPPPFSPSFSSTKPSTQRTRPVPHPVAGGSDPGAHEPPMPRAKPPSPFKPQAANRQPRTENNYFPISATPAVPPLPIFLPPIFLPVTPLPPRPLLKNNPCSFPGREIFKIAQDGREFIMHRDDSNHENSR